jgi:hypothetical protein
MTPCPIEDCPRYGWPVYEGLCGPHRAEWAANNARDISQEERSLWLALHKHAWADGSSSSTWPHNFITPARPSRADLSALEAECAKERQESDRQRLEN